MAVDTLVPSDAPTSRALAILRLRFGLGPDEAYLLLVRYATDTDCSVDALVNSLIDPVAGGLVLDEMRERP